MQKVHVLELEALTSHRSREGPGGSRGLPVCVPFTTSDLTRAALTAAVALTRNLGARVSLVAVLTGPFPLPLDRPAVSSRLVEHELQAVARDIEVPVDAHVAIPAIAKRLSIEPFRRDLW
jgi:hypothetical protein